jgi:hypothetical protein
MNFKTHIIPWEAIQVETEFGTLETGRIPTDPHDPNSKEKWGRILVLKTPTENKIIGWIPAEWKITLGPNNNIRTNSPEKEGKVTVYEGNLKDAIELNPWENEKEILPWATRFEIELGKEAIGTETSKIFNKVAMIETDSKSLTPIVFWTEENNTASGFATDFLKTPNEENSRFDLTQDFLALTFSPTQGIEESKGLNL